jgi:hypothetical protein
VRVYPFACERQSLPLLGTTMRTIWEGVKGSPTLTTLTERPSGVERGTVPDDGAARCRRANAPHRPDFIPVGMVGVVGVYPVAGVGGRY